MSSAALQSPPHRPSALASSPLASPSAHQYSSSHSSPNNEAAHYASQPMTTQSPRRQTGYKSTNDPQYSGAAGSSQSSWAVNSPDRNSPSSDRANMPPVAPPRTSSTQQSGSARRSHQSSEKIAGSPRHQVDSSSSTPRSEANGTRENGQRSKRNGNSYTSDASMHPGNRDGRSATTSLPVRPHQPTNSKPSREASENLIRAISNVDEPNGRDVRQDRHAVVPTEDAAPPPVVASSAGSDDQRRGGRTRHDHSRGHKATTKFGDFILGNTIGEGEFGKVKLGWKQDSNVQVRTNTSPRLCIKELTGVSSGCY